MSGKGLKLVGGALVLTGGYYLYKQQTTGQKAEVLAKQDFNSIVKSTENTVNKGTFSAENAGKSLDNKYEQTKQDLEAKLDSARQSASSEAKRLGQEAKNVVDQASSETKGAVDKVSGWFK